VLEHSTNRLDWDVWDVPGKQPWSSSDDMMTVIGGATEAGSGHFFRCIIGEP
jgi:hypothetical protein